MQRDTSSARSDRLTRGAARKALSPSELKFEHPASDNTSRPPPLLPADGVPAVGVPTAAALAEAMPAPSSPPLLGVPVAAAVSLLLLSLLL
jgi:hypothetical protein